jgi:anti-sigma factor RsiW
MTTELPADLRDLHAYVDSQLPAAEQQRIEALLGRNPEAEARVSDYRALGIALSDLYDPIVSEPVPRRLRTPARRLRWWNLRGKRPSLQALAAGVLLVLGGGWGGWHLHQEPASLIAAGTHVLHEAAAAYAVYTPEVLHPVEVAAEQEQHLVAWLTKRLAAPVTAPSLTGVGFSLLGGRLLSTDDGPGALLIYENAEGRRIVLYICRNDLDGRSTSFRFGQNEGISVFYWFDGPFSIAVAAELERPELQVIAEQVYREFEA